MTYLKHFLFYSTFVLLLISSACKKESSIDATNTENNEVVLAENERLTAALAKENITNINTFLTGIIKDENGMALSNVTVSYGTTEVTTGTDGRFSFGEISIKNKYAVIKASKANYLTGFKTISPTANALNTVGMQLLTTGNKTTINAATGGTVSIDNVVKVEFSANSLITEAGVPFAGNVVVTGRYLDPKADYFAQTIPGMLAGLTNQEEITALISYGMLTVELRDESGKPIEIAAGNTAKITMPDNSYTENTIPLWHFNEANGLWVEAGIATKSGSTFVAEVNHFSTWNLDSKVNPIFDVVVTITDPNGNVLANQPVTVLSNNGLAHGQIYTDNNGQFNLLRAPQNLVFKLGFCDGSTGISSAITDVSSGAATIILNTGTRSYTLTGNISDCDANGNTLTYNNKFFTISGNDIYNGGTTDNSGNYSLTTVLCNEDGVTPYNFNAVVYTSNTTAKDTALTLTFSGNSQVADIDYCGAAVGTCLYPDSCFIIPFVDANLEQGVRVAINKPSGVITYGDVKGIDTLNLPPSNITNLAGLEYFESLKSFGVTLTMIRDLSPLASLTNLTGLYLPNNQINDISPLAGLTNLTYLELNSNQISDISALAGLINLDYLGLHTNQISDISALAGLTSLTQTNLAANQITDISPLAGLSNLTFLIAGNNQITDASSLCGLGTSYTGTINLTGNAIPGTGITALQACLPNATITF